SQHAVERKEAAAAPPRHEILTPIRYFAVKRLQGAFGIRVAGAIGAILKVRPYVQAFVACREKQANQATPQDGDVDEQLFLEQPERRVAGYAIGQQVVKRCLGFRGDRGPCDWTIVRRLVRLTSHGADSEP